MLLLVLPQIAIKITANCMLTSASAEKINQKGRLLRSMESSVEISVRSPLILHILGAEEEEVQEIISSLIPILLTLRNPSLEYGVTQLNGQEEFSQTLRTT